MEGIKISLIKIELTNTGDNYAENVDAKTERLERGLVNDNQNTLDKISTDEVIESKLLDASGRKEQTLAAGKGIGLGLGAAALSNVGTFTGSQSAQNQANNLMKLGALGIGAFVSPGLTVALTAVSIANNALDLAKKTKEDIAQSNRNSQRLGRIKYNNGRNYLNR